MNALEQYDTWLVDDGPAALVIREHLIPVEGPDGVLFPASFAPEEGADKDRSKFQGGYNIDHFDGGTSAKIGLRPPRPPWSSESGIRGIPKRSCQGWWPQRSAPTTSDHSPVRRSITPRPRTRRMSCFLHQPS